MHASFFPSLCRNPMNSKYGIWGNLRGRVPFVSGVAPSLLQGSGHPRNCLKLLEAVAHHDAGPTSALAPLSSACLLRLHILQPLHSARKVRLPLGAILAPLASGALLDCGWSPALLYALFSAPFAIAAVAMLLIGPSRGPRS